jgi:hypothetical protein
MRGVIVFPHPVGLGFLPTVPAPIHQGWAVTQGLLQRGSVQLYRSLMAAYSDPESGIHRCVLASNLSGVDVGLLWLLVRAARSCLTLQHNPQTHAAAVVVSMSSWNNQTCAIPLVELFDIP